MIRDGRNHAVETAAAELTLGRSFVDRYPPAAPRDAL
jgi:hypothetical protein